MNTKTENHCNGCETCYNCSLKDDKEIYLCSECCEPLIQGEEHYVEENVLCKECYDNRVYCVACDCMLDDDRFVIIFDIDENGNKEKPVKICTDCFENFENSSVPNDNKRSIVCRLCGCKLEWDKRNILTEKIYNKTAYSSECKIIDYYYCSDCFKREREGELL